MALFHMNFPTRLTLSLSSRDMKPNCMTRGRLNACQLATIFPYDLSFFSSLVPEGMKGCLDDVSVPISGNVSLLFGAESGPCCLQLKLMEI